MSVFKSPKQQPIEPAPAPEPPPPPPERSDTETQRLAEAQRRKFFSGKNIDALALLSGSRGVSESSTSSAVRMLGGVGKV